jgi:hypothetical protein
LHALKRDVGREQVTNLPDIGAAQIDAAQLARHALGVIGHEHLPLVVVVARDRIRRGQDFVHRRVEPALGARANQFAADEKDEDCRHERHAEEQQDQLGAEPRERQRAPLLDDQLDDVARQNEHQRGQHRDIGRRQGVENEFAQEARREARRPARGGQQREQHAQQHHDAGEDQPRVVAERPPRAHLRRPGRPSRGDRRDGSRHDPRHG